MNRINNCLEAAPLCNTSTSSRILTKQATHGPDSKPLQTSDHHRRSKKQIVSIHLLSNDVIWFRPAKTESHSSLHWDLVGLKPLKEPKEAANLQSSQKVSIAHGCKRGETKLGCVSKAPLSGSGQTFVRTKTYTVPPCVYTGPAELEKFLNRWMCKFRTWK